MELSKGMGRTGRARRELSDETFEALLRALGPAREQAGQRYEAIRARLLKFFAWRGMGTPEELTDETFDRVGRRLAEGEVIRDGAAYFLGVARNVAREAWDREQRRGPQEAFEQALASGPPAAGLPADESPSLACLRRCLAGLEPETRELVLDYYELDGREQIDGRRALASRLRVSPALLRLRLHRVRARLEDCVRACLAGGAPRPAVRSPRATEEDGA